MANEQQKQEGESKRQKRPTSQKREGQNERKRVQNKAFRSRVKTSLKGFLESLKSSDKKQQMAAYSEISSLVDKGVNNGVYKKNKASRIKARLAIRLQTK